MKKVRKYIQGVLLLLTAFLAVSCEKDKYANTLPPETQEGKNTFGCFVNNELWKIGNPTTFHPAFYANLKDGVLAVYSSGGKKNIQNLLESSLTE